MVNLDNPDFINTTLNGKVVFESVNFFPNQCREAWHESSSIKFPLAYKSVKNIVVSGMGGSRFAPLIIQKLFKENITIPVLIDNNYSLPGFVDKNTLVILSSYSGTTEEVLQCGETAKKMGAKISGICADGPLSIFLKKNHFPAYIFKAKYNPSHQPRIGVGYMTAGHMGLLYALGFLKIKKHEIEKALEQIPGLLSDFQIDRKLSLNPAKQMAKTLFQKYPYYITAEHLQGVGNGLANQTNETAKSISSFRFIPELNHHLMEGLKFPEEMKNFGVFVFFSSKFYDPRVKLRFQITQEVIKKNGWQVIWHNLNGKSRIAEVFELIGFGNYMTLYLSALYEEDPSVIPWVDYFKNRLKELV